MNELASGLVDIIEPAAPVPDAVSNLFWLVVAILLLVLLAAGLLVWWRKQRAGRLLAKRLQALRSISQSRVLTQHEMVYLIALELRRGLNLARLLPDAVPALLEGDDVARWPDFVRHLDALRYQPEIVLDESQLDMLVTQTESWLRRYTR